MGKIYVVFTNLTYVLTFFTFVLSFCSFSFWHLLPLLVLLFLFLCLLTPFTSFVFIALLFFCSSTPPLVLLFLLLYSLVFLGFVASLLFCLLVPQAKFCCSCSFAHWYFFRFCCSYFFFSVNAFPTSIVLAILVVGASWFCCSFFLACQCFSWFYYFLVL